MKTHNNPSRRPLNVLQILASARLDRGEPGAQGAALPHPPEARRSADPHDRRGRRADGVPGDLRRRKWARYFALCLFASIRPGVPRGENTNLKPEAVNLDDGVIHIGADVSKVREPRKVTIQSNLAAWLRAYLPLDKYPILGNFKKRKDRFAKNFKLTHDVLRHTFISIFAGKFRSIGEAAIQAGNSEAIIRKHCLDLKTTFWIGVFQSVGPKRNRRRYCLGWARRHQGDRWPNSLSIPTYFASLESSWLVVTRRHWLS